MRGAQFFQLLLVAHIYRHFDQRRVVVPVHVRLRFEAAHIGVFIRQNAGELMQQPGPVVGMNDDAHRERIARIARPVDFDPALRIVHQILHVGTCARMHRDSLAPGDVADDGFAFDRIAALRPVDHDVVDAVNFDDGIVVFLPVAVRWRGRGVLHTGAAPAAVVPRSPAPGADFCSTWRAENLP